MSENRRPPRLIKDFTPDPEKRVVSFRMSTGAPYIVQVPPEEARKVVENLADYWDGVSSESAPRLIGRDGRGFLLNPAHVVSVDIR